MGTRHFPHISLVSTLLMFSANLWSRSSTVVTPFSSGGARIHTQAAWPRGFALRHLPFSLPAPTLLELGVSNLISQMNTWGFMVTRTCLSPHLVPEPALEPSHRPSKQALLLRSPCRGCSWSCSQVLCFLVHSPAHVAKAMSYGVGMTLSLLFLNAGGSPQEAGGWAGLRNSKLSPRLIVGQREGVGTLTAPLKKPPDFVIFSYLPLEFY